MTWRDLAYVSRSQLRQRNVASDGLRHFEGRRCRIGTRVALLVLLPLFFFSFQDVGRHEFDELVIEDVENFAAKELEFVLLAREIIVHDLHDGRTHALIVFYVHRYDLFLGLLEDGEGIVRCFLQRTVFLGVVLFAEE